MALATARHHDHRYGAAMRIRLLKDTKDRLRERSAADALLDMSPAEIDAWVDANVNNLADVKRALVRLAILVAAALRGVRAR